MNGIRHLSFVIVSLAIVCVDCQIYGNGADFLEGSMSDFEQIHGAERHKREADTFRTADELLKYLYNEVKILRSRVVLLEKDNALFQQTIALVTKITDKRLSKYTCGCLREILDDEGAVPCHMTTVMPPTVTEPTPVVITATPTCENLASENLASVNLASENLASVQYQDSAEVKPLDPSVFAVSYYGSKFFRYIFDSKLVEPMPNERKNTYAVTFDPVEEKLIWASYDPDAIYSSKVDYTDLLTLKNDILSYGLAVDPNKNLLFATTVSPHRAVAVMYTNGTGYKLIAHASKYGRPSRITLDTKNEMTFVAFRSRILRVSYDGSHQSVLLEGRYITSLTFDFNDAVLYYADRIVIHKVKDTTVDNPKTMRVVRFKPKSGSYPSDLSVRGDKMYIGYKFKKVVQEMTLPTRKLKTLATLDGDFISLCTGP